MLMCRFFYSSRVGTFMLDKSIYPHNVIRILKDGVYYEAELDEFNITATYVSDGSVFEFVPDKFYPCDVDYGGYASVEV